MWCVPFFGTVGLFNKLKRKKKHAGVATHRPRGLTNVGASVRPCSARVIYYSSRAGCCNFDATVLSDNLGRRESEPLFGIHAARNLLSSPEDSTEQAVGVGPEQAERWVAAAACRKQGLYFEV